MPQTVSDTQDLTLSGIIVCGTESPNCSYPHPLVTEYLYLLLMLCNLKLIFLLVVEMRTCFILQSQSYLVLWARPECVHLWQSPLFPSCFWSLNTFLTVIDCGCCFVFYYFKLSVFSEQSSGKNRWWKIPVADYAEPWSQQWRNKKICRCFILVAPFSSFGGERFAQYWDPCKDSCFVNLFICKFKRDAAWMFIGWIVMVFKICNWASLNWCRVTRASTQI